MQQKEHPMNDASIRFNDGAAYERMMGGWSRIAGDVFLDWLAPRPDLAWVEIESRTISVQRSFTDFDDYWGASTLGPSVAAALTSMTPAEIDQFKSRVRANLKVGGAGPLTFSARANAIKGRVPE